MCSINFSGDSSGENLLTDLCSLEHSPRSRLPGSLKDIEGVFDHRTLKVFPHKSGVCWLLWQVWPSTMDPGRAPEGSVPGIRQRETAGLLMGPACVPCLEPRAGTWALAAAPHTLSASPKAAHAQLRPAQACSKDPASEHSC